MRLRNKKTGDVWEFDEDIRLKISKDTLEKIGCTNGVGSCCASSLAELNDEWEDYEPAESLIKDEKARKAVRVWVEAENCTSEMNLYYTLNRREKYIIFHNPQTGSELQLREFDYPDFKELCEYTISELCGEEEE